MYKDKLGRRMGHDRECVLCSNVFLPSGVRQLFCKACIPTARRLNVVLQGMKYRCRQGDGCNRCYAGLSAHTDWVKVPVEFFRWAIQFGWADGLQIDRINPKDGYHPENCRFVTPRANARNRRDLVTDFVKGTRRCYTCHVVKILSQFHRSRTYAAGREYVCKECRRAQDRVRHARNRLADKK